MRIGLLSDIHLNINRKKHPDLTAVLTAVLAEAQLKALVLAGDLAASFDESRTLLETLEDELGIPVYFVTGNHDIWASKEETSDELYRRFLSLPGNLTRGPRELDGGWAICGRMGWYDYSFGNPAYSKDEYRLGRHDGKQWRDCLRADWEEPDQALHQRFLAELEGDILSCEAPKLIAVTHVVPRREFTVPLPHKTWDFYNAYLGSCDYGALFNRHRRVKHAVFGHVHYRGERIVDDVHYHCPCLGYYTEWKDSAQAREAVEQSLQIVDLS